MLGTVMQAAGDPPRGEISSKLKDALLAAPGRPAKLLDPTDLWFSASDVHNLCPRLYALAVRDRLPIREAVGPDLLWTFGVGTGFHHAMQNEQLPTLGPVLQGGWKRELRDGTVERVLGTTLGPWTETGRGWGPRPPGDYWEFVEPKGRIPHLRFVGKWDGVLVWPDSAPEVLEIKSIHEDRWASVNPLAGGRPKADHVLQVQAYLWLSGLERGRLVYIAKGSSPLRHVMCEHLVVRDEVAIRGLEAQLEACGGAVRAMVAALDAERAARKAAEEAAEQALRVATAKSAGTEEKLLALATADRNAAEAVSAQEAAVQAVVRALPERPAICRIKSDPRARRCDLRDACFPPKPKKEKAA